MVYWLRNGSSRRKDTCGQVNCCFVEPASASGSARDTSGRYRWPRDKHYPHRDQRPAGRRGHGRGRCLYCRGQAGDRDPQGGRPAVGLASAHYFTGVEWHALVQGVKPTNPAELAGAIEKNAQKVDGQCISFRSGIRRLMGQALTCLWGSSLRLRQRLPMAGRDDETCQRSMRLGLSAGDEYVGA